MHLVSWQNCIFLQKAHSHWNTCRDKKIIVIHWWIIKFFSLSPYKSAEVFSYVLVIYLIWELLSKYIFYSKNNRYSYKLFLTFLFLISMDTYISLAKFDGCPDYLAWVWHSSYFAVYCPWSAIYHEKGLTCWRNHILVEYAYKKNEANVRLSPNFFWRIRCILKLTENLIILRIITIHQRIEEEIYFLSNIYDGDSNICTKMKSAWF